MKSTTFRGEYWILSGKITRTAASRADWNIFQHDFDWKRGHRNQVKPKNAAACQLIMLAPHVLAQTEAAKWSDSFQTDELGVFSFKSGLELQTAVTFFIHPHSSLLPWRPTVTLQFPLQRYLTSDGDKVGHVARFHLTPRSAGLCSAGSCN